MLIKIPNWVDFVSITASKKIRGYTINKRLKTMNLGKILTKKSLVLPHIIKLPPLLIVSKDNTYLYGLDAIQRYLNTSTVTIVTKDNEDYKEKWFTNLISGE